MKVILTEQGFEFYRKLKLEQELTMPTRIVFSPKKASNNSGKPKLQKAKSNPQLLLDNLLPAVITINPPKDILVKNTRVKISKEFINKYYIPKRSIFMPYNTQSNLPIYKYVSSPIASKMDVTLREFCKTLKCNKMRCKTSNFSTEFVANELINKTLRLKKVEEMQLKQNEYRSKLAYHRHNYLKREAISADTQLETNARALEKGNLFERVTSALASNRARHKERMLNYYKVILKKWRKNEQIQKLSICSKRRSKVSQCRSNS